MSSLTVRTLLKDFIATKLPAEVLIDLSDEVGEFQELVEAAGLEYTVDKWLGIDFIGFDEYPVDILATNTTGCYREDGTVMLFIVEPMNSTGSPRDKILIRAESIMNAFRGERISSLIIHRISPANFKAESNVSFEGGYTSAMISIDFHNDKNL
jgi:hypothetical protein